MCIVIVEKHTGQHYGALLSSTKYDNTRCSSQRNASITLQVIRTVCREAILWIFYFMEWLIPASEHWPNLQMTWLIAINNKIMWPEELPVSHSAP